MRDDDRLLDLPEPEFGSGIVGVCDICGERQASVVLLKERYRLCVLDFLNKTWLHSDRRPSAPVPLYRTDRIWYDSDAARGGRAPAIVLSPTKTVRHPVVLIAPDTYGITTTILDAAIRFAREGFEVLIPDLGKTDGFGFAHHAALRAGVTALGGVPATSGKVLGLVALYRYALRHLLAREMVDPSRSAVFGVGYGGALALAVAAEGLGLTAVAVAYPPPLRPASLATLVTAKVLLVRGESDRLAARAERQLQEGAAGPNHRSVVLPGARSGFLSRDLRAYDLALAERGWSEIVGFLKQQMMPPLPTPPPPPTKSDPIAGPAKTPTPAARPPTAPAPAQPPAPA